MSYRLGFRGLVLLIGAGIGMWVFFVPVMMLLEHLWPLRPELSWPDTGTLGLLGTPPGQHPPQRDVPTEKAGQDDSTSGAGDPPEAPPPQT